MSFITKFNQKKLRISGHFARWKIFFWSAISLDGNIPHSGNDCGLNLVLTNVADQTICSFKYLLTHLPDYEFCNFSFYFKGETFVINNFISHTELDVWEALKAYLQYDKYGPLNGKTCFTLYFI